MAAMQVVFAPVTCNWVTQNLSLSIHRQPRTVMTVLGISPHLNFIGHLHTVDFEVVLQV